LNCRIRRVNRANRKAAFNQTPQESMVRIAALLAVTGAIFAAEPADAQFGNLFGGPPPRPPADVPSGPFPAQPPPVQYPGQAPPPQQYPGPPNPAPRSPSGIQAQPLAPPPGASNAPAPQPGQRMVPPPSPQGARNAPAPANPPPPQPADTAPQSDDTVVTVTPTQKIENGRAVFSGLDKITGRIISFDAAIGETVQFGALQVTARACYTRPPTEATNTDAFVEVDEVTLQGEIKRIFTGWMFASSPGLHAVEHPVYDVWLTDCASPAPGSVAQSTPPPVPAGAPPPVSARPRQSAPPRQPGKPTAPQPAPQSAPVTDD
jgi:hypothetical protein